MYRLDENKLNEKLKYEVGEKLEICNKLYNDPEFCFFNHGKIKEENLEHILVLLEFDYDVFEFKVSKNIIKYLESEIQSKFPDKDLLKIQYPILYLLEFRLDTRHKTIEYNATKSKLKDLEQNLDHYNEKISTIKLNIECIKERIEYITKNKEIINECISGISSFNTFKSGIATYDKKDLLFRFKNTKKRRNHQLHKLKEELLILPQG